MGNKAFFFDIDDTLIPTSDFLDEVVKQSIIAMINAGLPEDDPDRAVARAHYIRRYNREWDDNDFDILCHAYGVNDLSIVKAGVQRYQKMKLGSLQANVHAKSTLDYLLSQDFKLGVISTGRPEKQRDKLEIIGLFEYFKDCFHSSLDPNLVKPNPALFLRALEETGAEASDSFYIGNRLDVDVVGAHNAGLHSVLFEFGKYAGQTPVSLLLKRGISGKDILSGKYNEELRLLTPDYTINSLGDIRLIV